MDHKPSATMIRDSDGALGVMASAVSTNEKRSSGRSASKEGDLHFHDLRGTAVTKLYIFGIPKRVIAEIMAWEEEHVARIIRRYVDRRGCCRRRRRPLTPRRARSTAVRPWPANDCRPRPPVQRDRRHQRPAAAPGLCQRRSHEQRTPAPIRYRRARLRHLCRVQAPAELTSTFQQSRSLCLKTQPLVLAWG